LESTGGIGLAGAGIGATLRDYGRFGVFVQQDGMIDDERIVPEGWFREAGRAHVIGSKSVDYGYLWWPMPAGDLIHDGAFEARGIFGQHLYINSTAQLRQHTFRLRMIGRFENLALPLGLSRDTDGTLQATVIQGGLSNVARRDVIHPEARDDEPKPDRSRYK
jgi:hypothetical protein